MSNISQTYIGVSMYEDIDKNISTSSLSVNISKQEMEELIIKLYTPRYVDILTYLILFIIGAPANFQVLKLLINNNLWRQSRHHLLLLNLASADSIVMFVMVPGEVLKLSLITWRSNNFNCKLFNFFRVFGLYESSFVLVCISIDRYFAVCRPFEYQIVGNKIHVMIITSWLLAFIVSLPQTYVFGLGRHKVVDTFIRCRAYVPYSWLHTSYNIFSLTFMFIIPLLIIFICYLRICFETVGRPTFLSISRISSKRRATDAKIVIAGQADAIFNTDAKRDAERDAEREKDVELDQFVAVDVQASASDPYLDGKVEIRKRDARKDDEDNGDAINDKKAEDGRCPDLEGDNKVRKSDSLSHLPSSSVRRSEIGVCEASGRREDNGNGYEDQNVSLNPVGHELLIRSALKVSTTEDKNCRKESKEGPKDEKIGVSGDAIAIDGTITISSGSKHVGIQQESSASTQLPSASRSASPSTRKKYFLQRIGSLSRKQKINTDADDKRSVNRRDFNRDKETDGVCDKRDAEDKKSKSFTFKRRDKNLVTKRSSFSTSNLNSSSTNETELIADKRDAQQIVSTKCVDMNTESTDNFIDSSFEVTTINITSNNDPLHASTSLTKPLKSVNLTTKNNQICEQQLSATNTNIFRSSSSRLERRAEDMKRSIMRQTLIIVIAYFICWLPYAFMVLWHQIDEASAYQFPDFLAHFFFTLAVSNSAVNPYIYGRFLVSGHQHGH